MRCGGWKFVFVYIRKWKNPVNSRRLLFIRIRQNWNYQYSHIKSILDWTVMVYLIVPAIIIGALVYRSWWLELPSWIGAFLYRLYSPFLSYFYGKVIFKHMLERRIVSF